MIIIGVAKINFKIRKIIEKKYKFFSKILKILLFSPKIWLFPNFFFAKMALRIFEIVMGGVAFKHISTDLVGLFIINTLAPPPLIFDSSYYVCKQFFVKKSYAVSIVSSVIKLS